MSTWEVELNRRMEVSSRAIELDPTDTEAWYLRGTAFHANGTHHEAIKCFDQAIALLPKRRPKASWWSDAVPYVDRAVAYCTLREFHRALADCMQAVDLDPKYFYGWHVRGRAYLMMKDDVNAIQDFSQAILLQSFSPPSYALRAEAYSRLRLWENAIADASTVIEFCPEDYHAWYLRGNAFLMQDDYDKAIHDFDKSIILNPNLITDKGVKSLSSLTSQGKYTLLYTRAFYLSALLKCHYLHDHEGAEKDCDAAIQQEPSYGYAYIVRGHARRHLGKHRGALANYTTAISLLKQYPYAYLSRGQAYKRLRRLDEAIADYCEAIRLEPNWSAAFLCRAGALFAKGDLPGAIADCSEAIRLDSENLAAFENRSRAYRLIGDFTAAEQDEITAANLRKKLNP